jgi:hypothetical protein
MRIRQISIFPALCTALFMSRAVSAQLVPSGQAQNLTTPAGMPAPRGCSAELRGNRPKIYIANFYVTYGKKDMGKAIGDYIAEKFETDGRLEIISRSMINEQMKALLNSKKLKAEKYLEETLSYAAREKADCLVFGRISKVGTKVSFLVRMAAVESGENLRKVDTEVERDAALGFLETVGDSFVSFFVTAAPVVAEKPVEKEQPRAKNKGAYAVASSVSLMPFGFLKNGFNVATGGSGELGYKGFLGNDLIFAANLEYLYYFPKDETFNSLYGLAAFGVAGYEFLTYDKMHFQLLLYGGYQFGRLNGAVEAVSYGYGFFMAGTRAIFDINKRFSITVEPRYVLQVAGATQISSAAASVGALWRF